MYDEVNSFVSFIKDAAEGGSSREMAFVLAGGPGNGKTFFVDNLCALYRQFPASPENRRYTFNFAHLDKLGGYGKIETIQSQTFEDPVIPAMNLFESRDEGKEFLAVPGDFPDQQIDRLQEQLTAYAIGNEAKTTLTKERPHQDPNLNYVNMIIGIDAGDFAYRRVVIDDYHR